MIYILWRVALEVAVKKKFAMLFSCMIQLVTKYVNTYFDSVTVCDIVYIKFINDINESLCLVFRSGVILVNFVHRCSVQSQNLASMLAWYLFNLYPHQKLGMKSLNLHGQMTTGSMFLFVVFISEQQKESCIVSASYSCWKHETCKNMT
jgi:hypothetical protein